MYSQCAIRDREILRGGTLLVEALPDDLQINLAVQAVTLAMKQNLGFARRCLREVVEDLCKGHRMFSKFLTSGE